jgi:hypothetical protein
MDFFKSIWVWIIGSLTSVFVFVRSVVLIRLTLPTHLALYLLERIQKEGRVLEFEKEYVAHRPPLKYSALVWMNGTLFYYSIGSSSGDSDEGPSKPKVDSGHLTCCRWHIDKIVPQPSKSLFDTNELTKVSPGIYIVYQYNAEKVGDMDCTKQIVPYLESDVYEELESDIREVIKGERSKVGALMHGLPGNGKSYLIRYFCIKYRLPLYIFGLERGLDNRDIIKMFNNIKSPGIVLFEDFDSYFNKRECQLERPDFTFDVILNGIDGLFSDSRGLIYFMTANDIDKIDPALKERPSRFKYILNISNPSVNIRGRIFNGDEELIKQTLGFTLDQCLSHKDKLEYQQRQLNATNK